jgi:endonuclease/exonuclease/phosphatase family metal-dependent hydrolase
MGMDGNISTDRIARVIARQDPDIIALQELDAFRPRSRSIDQASKIAQYLEIKHHFHPVFCQQEEQYGNAILSRHPIKVIQMKALPGWNTKKWYEPRGAMWIEYEFQGKRIQVLNTHLSLWPKERSLQIDALLSEQWLGQLNGETPIILCGDFNAMPGSTTYRKVCKRFKESQSIVPGHRPNATWFGRYPVSQIDHIFITPQFQIKEVFVPRTSLDAVASDHLPLVADISFISI